uniref:NADH-ubiquinone oxidoreductase chain 3 n=1 Tax=Acerentomon sp. JD-2012 TaxID=1258700 RepID=U3LGH5_9HEXA|nr:NADH dehydrogenase subunit 3 [Acerentomon sp. JD-2012]
MMIIFYLIFTPLLISLMILLMTYLISSKNVKLREKFSTFECGFENKILFRESISIRFFFILLIFLIFDVEIILILPFLDTIEFSNFNLSCLSLSIFLIILSAGLILELNLGTLKWN